ncbi:LytTR family DNA-binding domain-containing protein [Massilimicrobiota sp. An134]|uniref:LytR/AlgR family response regulator transcription factor n=1 Tax=Massilimicrobiota sp. An134 TaxID=1965557 RepID=UPI000B375818|nr:LytTR family DNA-binding domain-containing protein [Massilimicrobiota sp. An134]OUQ25941.1 hypothetical protein B5E79_11640 [Massilimicrobiota sp. An134]
MKLEIAICDDDISTCSDLDLLLMDYGKENNHEFSIDIFYDEKRLYQMLTEGKKYEILFLDIELNNEHTGIDIGNYIRDELKNEEMKIVFISSKESYAMSLFEIRPTHFLIKPLVRNQIYKLMEKILSIFFRDDYFSFKIRGHIYKLKMSDILYFEGSNRKVKIVLRNEIIEFYSSLQEVFEQVKDRKFYFVHKSYLINYEKVIVFKYDELIMLNGNHIPISQAKRKYIREMQLLHEREML